MDAYREVDFLAGQVEANYGNEKSCGRQDVSEASKRQVA